MALNFIGKAFLTEVLEDKVVKELDLENQDIMLYDAIS